MTRPEESHCGNEEFHKSHYWYPIMGGTLWCPGTRLGDFITATERAIANEALASKENFPTRPGERKLDAKSANILLLVYAESNNLARVYRIENGELVRRMTR